MPPVNIYIRYNYKLLASTQPSVIFSEDFNVVVAAAVVIALIIFEFLLDASDLAKFFHALLGIILLDHLVVVLWMLDFYVLLQTSFGPVAFWAVVDWTFVVPGDLGCDPSMSFLLFIVDLEWHTQGLLMLLLIGLEPIKIIIQVLFLV